MINLTPFPIRIGAPDAEEIPSSGAARVVSVNTDATTIVEVAGRAVIARHFAPADRVLGLPLGSAEDIIVPPAVAAAMRELQEQYRGRVFTPGMLREENGVKFAPELIRHPDLEMVIRRAPTS